MQGSEANVLYGTEVTSTNSNNVRNKRFLCYSSDANQSR